VSVFLDLNVLLTIKLFIKPLVYPYQNSLVTNDTGVKKKGSHKIFQAKSHLYNSITSMLSIRTNSERKRERPTENDYINCVLWSTDYIRVGHCKKLSWWRRGLQGVASFMRLEIYPIVVQAVFCFFSLFVYENFW